MRATLGGTMSQSATFSLALPSDETLSSQTLPGGGRTNGAAGLPRRQDVVRFDRRIHRCAGTSCSAVHDLSVSMNTSITAIMARHLKTFSIVQRWAFIQKCNV